MIDTKVLEAVNKQFLRYEQERTEQNRRCLETAIDIAKPFCTQEQYEQLKVRYCALKMGQRMMEY